MRALDPKKGLFTIGVAAELVGVEPRVLRFYESKGLIQPARSDGNRRLYSLEDLELLEYVHYMTHVEKVNLTGVKAILGLLDKMPPEQREEEIQKVERAIAELDPTSRKIYARGSDAVERNLLDERRKEEIHAEASQEAETQDPPEGEDVE